ncbi:MAG: hypothetical protein V3R98_02690 [Alphaproteobacteria bacterium]
MFLERVPPAATLPGFVGLLPFYLTAIGEWLIDDSPLATFMLVVVALLISLLRIIG